MSSTASMAKSSFLVSRIMFAQTATPIFRVLLARFSSRKRIGTMGHDARRAKPGLLPTARARKRRHDHEVRLRNSGKNQLGDTVPRPDLDYITGLRRISVPCRNQTESL